MKKLFAILIITSMLTSLASCKGDSSNTLSDTADTVSVVSEYKNTSSTASVSAVITEQSPWPQNSELDSLPKLCDKVDYFSENENGVDGSFSIKLTSIEYGDFLSYANSLTEEHGFELWTTVGSPELPDTDSADSAFLAVKNEKLWGILVYTKGGNAKGYEFEMLFYDHDPYSGY